MLDTLTHYLAYPFVRYALVVGVLIALSSSLLGVTLVLKRYSYIGDGLSHVAFGAMAVATVLKLSNHLALILPLTVLAAILLLRSGQNAKIKGDAAIAMLSVGALAMGYLLMNIFGTASNLAGEISTTLFGSTTILTLTMQDVILCLVLSALVVAMFIVFYHRIFAVTFDETCARAVGIRAGVSALVIFPALSAMRVFQSFRAVTICSVILSVVCALAGILISILAGTPVGSTIVAADIVAFVLCFLLGKN